MKEHAMITALKRKSREELAQIAFDLINDLEKANDLIQRLQATNGSRQYRSVGGVSLPY